MTGGVTTRGADRRILIRRVFRGALFVVLVVLTVWIGTLTGRTAKFGGSLMLPVLFLAAAVTYGILTGQIRLKRPDQLTRAERWHWQAVSPILVTLLVVLAAVFAGMVLMVLLV